MLSTISIKDLVDGKIHTLSYPTKRLTRFITNPSSCLVGFNKDQRSFKLYLVCGTTIHKEHEFSLEDISSLSDAAEGGKELKKIFTKTFFQRVDLQDNVRLRFDSNNGLWKNFYGIGAANDDDLFGDRKLAFSLGRAFRKMRQVYQTIVLGALEWLKISTIHLKLPKDLRNMIYFIIQRLYDSFSDASCASFSAETLVSIPQ